MRLTKAIIDKGRKTRSARNGHRSHFKGKQGGPFRLVHRMLYGRQKACMWAVTVRQWQDSCIHMHSGLGGLLDVLYHQLAYPAQLTFRRSRLRVLDEFSSCSRYTPTRPSACSYLTSQSALYPNPGGRTHKVLLREMMRNWTSFSA